MVRSVGQSSMDGATGALLWVCVCVCVFIVPRFLLSLEESFFFFFLARKMMNLDNLGSFIVCDLRYLSSWGSIFFVLQHSFSSFELVRIDHYTTIPRGRILKKSCRFLLFLSAE
jgi:hypothetical protein